MKKIYTFLSAIILALVMNSAVASTLGISPVINSLSSSQDTVPKTTVYKNASAWFPFDGDGIDAKGTNNLALHHVTFIDDPTRGKVAEIGSIDTGYMEFAKNPIAGEQFSISTWFYWKSDAESWQVVFEFANSNVINGVHDNFYLSTKAGSTYGVVAESSKKGWENIASTVLPPVNQWVHMAITFDNSQVIVYMNGLQVGKGKLANTMADMVLNRFFIGADPIPGRYWRGLDARYDDFAVFGKVLSSVQINALAHDTIPQPPKAIPYVFEAEDYPAENWVNGTEDTITYSYYSAVPDEVPSALHTLNCGIIPGEGALTIWARIKTDIKVLNPLWTKINTLPWHVSDSIMPATGWQWVPVASGNLADGYHYFSLAAGASNLKIDKLLGTFDFTYDPNILYSKTDTIAPGIPLSLASSATTNSSTKLNWKRSADNILVTSYDILSNGRVITSTSDTTITLKLLSATSYSFTVRARDAAGNISDISQPLAVSTPALIFTVDFNASKQTIHHFGASDAWSVEIIGEKWPVEKREAIARYFFSKQTDQDGNPKGIGLSMWRVNIGEGSADQPSSGYSSGYWHRETQSFLNPDGSYNWNKQQGTQWFMNKAKEYGVNYFTGWLNSPPFFMTKNGYTFRTSSVSSYNLDPSNYTKFGEFLANVAKHFQDAGTPFSFMSPINEPQWGWSAEVGSASQSGSYCTNAEAAGVVKAINAQFELKNTDTKLLIPEAGGLNYLSRTTSDANTSNQVTSFWGKASANYVGNLSRMTNYVAGHSYFINGDATTAVTERQTLVTKMKAVNPALEFWQTEFSLLEDASEGKTEMVPMDYSIWLSRVIHFDLVEANCSGWSFWSSLSRPGVVDHAYRFALINWYPNAESRAACTDGDFSVSKNLWTLGNFSRFIRPGYKRVNIIRSDGLTTITSAYGQMASAYLSPSTDTLVMVLINYSEFDQQFNLNLSNIPANFVLEKLKPYITSATDDLKSYPEISALSPVYLKARSITTLVGVNENAVHTSLKPKNTSGTSVKIYPNPASDFVQIESGQTGLMQIILFDATGNKLKSQRSVGGKTIIPVKDLKPGSYFISVEQSGTVESHSLIIIR
ncbi:MAG: glycoside hydrolase [Bacteroidales bacterium]|nr:glycoside hydrolase [Bacteroidales bacterium]